MAEYPFTLGVASGSPLPTGVVLWTRLAPVPPDGGEAIPVRWEVAHDEGFSQVAAGGTAEALPEDAHSVHVEVEGLEPARWYFYRFIAASEDSPVGRTRTAPAAGSRPQHLRFGFGSCQHFEHGFYAAHRHLGGEDLDVMVFLGDYIYEGQGRAGRVRRHTGGETRSLAQYRNRYALYRTDPDLQRLHAAVPWLVTWDDHEVDNDYAAASPLGRDPDFLRRRTAAYRAYFEHMPLRTAARPRGSRMSLHSRHDFGRLVRFHLLDGRQYRSPQACRPANRVGRGCRERQDAGRTMLGAAQERWLRDGLAAVPGRWNVIAQASLMARASLPVGGEPRFRTDPWDGYPAARRRLLRVVSDPGARSCVVLSGDAHTCFVSDLKADFSDRRGPVIATELCGPSLTSDSRSQSTTDAIVRANPHIAFGDSTRRGYFVVDLTAERLLAQLRVLDDVARPDAAVSTAATFEILAGRPGVLRL